ncbi:hypothetical protein ACFQ6N_34390 [Kitasatospora sp. NPDC056446]
MAATQSPPLDAALADGLSTLLVGIRRTARRCPRRTRGQPRLRALPEEGR